MKTKKDFYFIVKQMRHLQKTVPGTVDCLMLQRDVDKEVESFFSKEIEDIPIDIEKKKIEYQRRMKGFHDSLVPSVEIYGKEMIRKFYDYWTEPNKSHTKMRWELEKTWDVKRRLITWSSREPVNKQNTSTKVIETESERLVRMTKEEKERDNNLVPVPKGYTTFTWYQHLKDEAEKGDQQAIMELGKYASRK